MTKDSKKDVQQAKIDALTVKQLSTKTGIPQSTIGDSSTWDSFETKRKGNKIAVLKSPKTRPLHRRTIETRADESSESPLTMAMRNDLELQYREVCSAEDLAKFDEMTFEEQNVVLELSKDYFDSSTDSSGG